MSNELAAQGDLGGKKIALIGSAPSSVKLAPYEDPSWTIWACSPGAAPHVKRVDAWFELHPLDRPDITPDYVQFMASLRKPVYLIAPTPTLPLGVAYPKEEMLNRFSPYFFTSSLAWMLALAISQNPAEIGLWGVDMSATEEYGYQRAGCHHFLIMAKAMGIEVTVPVESDLLRPPPLYGYCMGSPMYRKLEIRKQELERRIAECTTNYENTRNEFNFLTGARDDLNYWMNTWLN